MLLKKFMNMMTSLNCACSCRETKLRSSLSRTSETSALPRIWPLEESYRCIHMSNLLLILKLLWSIRNGFT